jgi:deoxyribonuclease-4
VTLLGAHVPIAGGLHKAPENARAIEATAIQIFTRNQVQWKAKPVSGEEADGFKRALEGTGVQVVMTHGSYLVNLASPDPKILAMSRAALLSDLERCHALGIPYLVFHPGAHMGAGEEAGLAAIAASLNEILAQTETLSVMPLLEVTAGQGSCLGHTFEHIAEILAQVREPERVGVCLDTCHLLAAGYDLATPEGHEDTLAKLERIVGLHKVKAVHLNDAKKGLGSRLDRHAHIGEGTLGLEAFRRIVNDPRLRHLPMVVETPGPAAVWKKEIALLRSLRQP